MPHKDREHYTARFIDLQKDGADDLEETSTTIDAPDAEENADDEESVEIQAEPKEFIFSKPAADSLGVEWLTYVNDELRKGADPLETLITAMKLLPDDNEPRKTDDMKYGFTVSNQMVMALGEKFLASLDEFLKLQPGKAQKAFQSEELDELRRKNTNKKSYRNGGRIIGADPPRV